MTPCCRSVGGAPMVRKILAAVFCVGICLSLATADEFRGKVKRVDADGKSITVDVDGKDMTFKTDAATKVTAGKKDSAKTLEKGLADKHLKEGANVVVTTPPGKKGVNTPVTEIRLGGKK